MDVNLYHNNFFAMGTRMDVVIWGVERRFAHLVFHDIMNETNRLESVLSRFDKNSDISRINASAGIYPVHVSNEVISILSDCLHYFELTGSLFDITALPLIKALKEQKQEGSNTDDASIDKARSFTGAEKLKLDKQQSTAYLDIEGMQMDLGGIGKGVALKHIDRILSEKGIDNAFISFGESSILAKGTHPYGDCWKIGIRHIHDSHRNVYSLELKDISLSTSGNTSEELRDIVNPQQGPSPDKILTTSVVANSPVDAEVLSTALIVASDEEKIRMIHKMKPRQAAEIIYINDEPQVNELFRNAENLTNNQELSGSRGQSNRAHGNMNQQRNAS